MGETKHREQTQTRIAELKARLDALDQERALLADELAGLRGAPAPEHAGMEEALSMFEQIIESTDDGIMIEDERGRVSFANAGLVRMLGYESREQVLNRPWPDFFSLEEERKIPGRPGMYESLLVTRDQSRIPILITSTSFYFHGEYRGVLSVIKDITEQKRAEQALARSEKYAAIAQLSMGISHEIKNPLSVLQAHLDLLHSNKALKQVLTEKLKYSLDVMETQSVRIAATVRSLSSLAQDRAPDIRLVNLVRLLDDTSDMFFPKLKKAHVELQRAYEKDSAVAVEADEGKLIQVITNLFFNALESMSDGGTLTVDAAADPSGGAIISITDTGAGIPPSTLNRITNPFFTTKPSGTGMGLAVCQRIIEEHHGNLFFDSAQGQGTIARIRLPLYQPKA